MATLTVPASVPAVAEDCEQLRKAFEGTATDVVGLVVRSSDPSVCARAGWGTNEALVVSILGHRDAAQRRAIRAAYAEAYGEELLRALNHEIHGKFEVRTTPPDPRHACRSFFLPSWPVCVCLIRFACVAIETEGGDPVDAGPGGAGRGAGQRGGQEVARGGTRARRDRMRAHARAALRRQAGIPRPIQAVARGGRRRARHRRIPQGTSSLLVPL